MARALPTKRRKRNLEGGSWPLTDNTLWLPDFSIQNEVLHCWVLSTMRLLCAQMCKTAKADGGEKEGGTSNAEFLKTFVLTPASSPLPRKAPRGLACKKASFKPGTCTPPGCYGWWRGNASLTFETHACCSHLAFPCRGPRLLEHPGAISKGEAELLRELGKDSVEFHSRARQRHAGKPTGGVFHARTAALASA